MVRNEGGDDMTKNGQKARGKRSGTKGRKAVADPMTTVLATYRDPEAADFGNAWAGIEPTFSNAKAVRKWAEMSATKEGEDLYFKDPWMLKTEKKIGKKIAERYTAWRAEGRACAMFDRVERKSDKDPWGTRRQNLHFNWRGKGFEDFEVKLAIDPEIFEYSGEAHPHQVVLRRPLRRLPAGVPLGGPVIPGALGDDRPRRRPVLTLRQDVPDGEPARRRHRHTPEPPGARHLGDGLAQLRRSLLPGDPRPDRRLPADPG